MNSSLGDNRQWTITRQFIVDGSKVTMHFPMEKDEQALDKAKEILTSTFARPVHKVKKP